MTNNRLSPRLRTVVDHLPLRKGLRVIEIGCGSGAAAREIARRIDHGHILAIDRSEKAIQQAIRASEAEIRSGRLVYRKVAVEDFELEKGEELYDIAFAVRVGALDGRHPESEKAALTHIAKALKGTGKLYIDTGNPLTEVPLGFYR